MKLKTSLCLTSLILLFLFDTCRCVNEDDNPVAFLMFEHHELCKDTFIKEQKLIENLRSIRRMLDARRMKIKTLLQDVGRKYASNTEDSVHDTITAFALLKRSALSLPTLKSKFQTDLTTHQQFSVFVNETTQDFPTFEDYNGAVKGMVMLHQTYDLYLEVLPFGQVFYFSSEGLIKDFKGRENLTIDDFYQISNKAKSQLLFDVAIEYLRVAFSLADKFKPSNSTMKKIKKLRKDLVQLNNQYLLKWEKLIGPNYKVLPYLVDDKMNYREHQPKKMMDNVHLIEIKNDYQRDYCFKQVCRSSAFTRQPDRVNLPKCGYLHHFDPYLRLGPFKVEVYLRSPYLSVLHDLLTEEEIQWMIEYSVPRLSRVRGNNGLIVPGYQKADKTNRRTVHKTVQCWIEDISYDDYNEINDPTNYTINFPLMFKLAKKLELATQLNVTGKYSSTHFQTTNYGLGGLCEKHLDPHGYIEGASAKGIHRGLVQTGDMIGTVMAWLGEVEGGGATAFLHQKVERALMPTRGSAAFWYDLDRKSHRDHRTLHGGCPIVKGSKWILNKWIYSFNQWNKYPCGLDPNQYISPPQGYYRTANQ